MFLSVWTEGTERWLCKGSGSNRKVLRGSRIMVYTLPAKEEGVRKLGTPVMCDYLVQGRGLKDVP